MADLTNSKTRADLVIDFYIGGHSDANIEAFLLHTKDSINLELIRPLLIQALARIETLEEA